MITVFAIIIIGFIAIPILIKKCCKNRPTDAPENEENEDKMYW